MYMVPSFEECIGFAKSIGAVRIEEIIISPREHDEPFQCHKNCEINPVLGYYFTKDAHGILHAFKHSVLKTNNGLIDVTPTIDDRKHNVFAYGITKYNAEHLTYVKNSVYINKFERETEHMYYVYALIDPRSGKPFYIGKGKDNRALSHFREASLKKEGNTKKTAMIKKLKSLGFAPMIEFYAQNIEDESLAYIIEEHYILKLGRIGYEENGILTNECIGANPPNHKGKTYSEIYGENEKCEIEKRRSLQIIAGGYGPKVHTQETKKKISNKTAGSNNPRYGAKVKGTVIAEKIGKANFGKKHYGRKDVHILYIPQLNKYMYSNDLLDFCNKHGYSHATFLAQLANGWPISKRGKNKGLLIQRVNKQDVSADTLKGLSL